MTLEVAGGLISGSLALLADAGHMLTDTAALALAWVAVRLTLRPTNPRRSYGYHRAQVLAAFVNALALFVVAAWIVVEAADRLSSPRPIEGGTMLGVALAGLLANVTVYSILRRGNQDNLNVSAARLHVMGDLLGSIGALVAAGIILATGWTPIDPILSVLVAILILRSAWSLLRKSTSILMEETPDSVDPDALRQALLANVPGVRDVARPALLVAHVRADHAHAARGTRGGCRWRVRPARSQARDRGKICDRPFSPAARAGRMPG